MKLERRIWERVVPKRQNYVDVTQGTTSTSGNGPPLDGSWVNLPTDEDNVADAKAKRYQSKVFDEECLSDDDMIRGDKYSFTPVGEAVHAANAAAGTTETSAGRRIGLRRRGEGARWDNTALGTGGRGLTTQHDARSTTRAQSHVWTPLTDPVEMQYYRFAVATDPGKARRCIASSSADSDSKLNYSETWDSTRCSMLDPTWAPLRHGEVG